jgi:hypothetical protein
VRVATTRQIDLAGSRATFDLRQYDLTGRELIHGTIEVGVAG